MSALDQTPGAYKVVCFMSWMSSTASVDFRTKSIDQAVRLMRALAENLDLVTPISCSIRVGIMMFEYEAKSSGEFGHITEMVRDTYHWNIIDWTGLQYDECL